MGALRFACLLSILTPAAAFAQVYTPPEGCVLEMTVQLASCRLSQHYRCESDTPGDQWAAWFDDTGGPVHVARIDAETRWMETIDPISDAIEYLGDEVDPASLSILLTAGRDDFDFQTEWSDGLQLRYKGFDRLTGEVATIDGVELLVTEFALTAELPGGQVIYSRKGGQFVSPEHGRFYGGREIWQDWTGASDRTDDTPRSFARPGQPGFASLTPVHGCNMQVARWD